MKLFIATPTHSGDVCHTFAVSLVNTIKTLTAAGIEARWQVLAYSGFIHSARNRLAAEFMASDYTDLLFADADMGWDVEGILRLIAEPAPVALAICPKKKDPLEWVFNGTALMRIKRRAFETLPKPWFNVEIDEEGRVITGEDAWFCRQWRDRGGEICRAPYIHVTHTGQKNWQGRYDHDSSGHR